MPFANSATITAGLHQFLDHPGGVCLEFGGYGLSLDFLSDDFAGQGPKGPKGPTFSVEDGGASLELDWYGISSTSISGIIYNNVTNEVWHFEHIITGITVTSDDGFETTEGTLI
ncbi:MAG: hypothetical protein AAF304_07650 [Pseudomonadota bacterium]